MFELVVAPQYLMELVMLLGMLIATNSVTALLQLTVRVAHCAVLANTRYKYDCFYWILY